MLDYGLLKSAKKIVIQSFDVADGVYEYTYTKRSEDDFYTRVGVLFNGRITVEVVVDFDSMMSDLIFAITSIANGSKTKLDNGKVVDTYKVEITSITNNVFTLGGKEYYV